MNVDYFFLDTDNQTHEFSEDAMTRLREYKYTYIHICVYIVVVRLSSSENV